jgi:hypothetical protein
MGQDDLCQCFELRADVVTVNLNTKIGILKVSKNNILQLCSTLPSSSTSLSCVSYLNLLLGPSRPSVEKSLS